MIKIRFIQAVSLKLLTTDLIDGKIIPNSIDFPVKLGKIIPVEFVSQHENLCDITLKSGILYNVPQTSIEVMTGELTYKPDNTCCPKLTEKK